MIIKPGFSLVAAVVCLAALVVPLRAEVLFPEPLHLVRSVSDPLTGTTTTIDEYYAGNRVVSVRGRRVSVVDYDKQTVTEIDHARRTYSVTRFEDVARARSSGTSTGPQVRRKWRVAPGAVRASSRHQAVAYQLVSDESGIREELHVEVDRELLLSRPAFEAIIGAAYPNVRTPQHDTLVDIAGRSDNGGVSAAAARPDRKFGLVAEQTLTVDADGARVVASNSVVSVDRASVSPDLLLIDPGATLVESRLTRLESDLREADSLPAPTSSH